MDFDPQKFFIGLMEFFSILLPGALLTYMLMAWAGPSVLGDEKYNALIGPAGWVAFLAASYMLGHLVFLLGSWLDLPYDWLRGRTVNKQVRRLARRDEHFIWPLRALVWLLFGRERDLTVNKAVEIKKR